MTVIKQNAWSTRTGLPEPTVQQLGENPITYRELLMESVQGEPFPYILTAVDAGETKYLRIPHGLSTDASVRKPGDPGDPNTVTAGHERIPDVVVPVMVDIPLSTTPGGALGAVSIALACDWYGALVPSPTTGLWVDESYVYLAVSNAGLAAATVAFVVYVEYTHSIIRNEIVFGEYYSVAFPT